MTLNKNFEKLPHWLAVFTLTLIGLCLYSNSLHGEFVSDDFGFVVHNQSIRNLKDLNGIWESYNTRFLVGLTFAFNYWLHGLSVFGFHLFNVCSHIIAGILVYTFSYTLFKTPYFTNSNLAQSSQAIAFGSAMVFLTHPVQTEATAYIMQRGTSMATIVYLSALIFYIQYRLTKNPLMWIASLCALITGFFTKEITITIPLTIMIIEFFFFQQGNDRLKQTLQRGAPFVAAIFLFFWVMVQAKTSGANHVSFVVGLDKFSWSAVLTNINVLRTHLTLFVLPINQSHSYDFPMVQSVFELPFLMSTALLGVLLYLAKKLYLNHRLFSFCLIWFFVATLVEVGAVAFGARDVMYEHWGYLSLVGLSILLVTSLFTIPQQPKTIKIVITLIVIVLSFLTVQRNQIWRTEISVWQDVVRKHPNRALFYLALGRSYQRKELFDLAIATYKKGLELDADDCRILNNMGTIYFRQKKPVHAQEVYDRAIKKFPNSISLYNNLGYGYFLNGNCAQSIRYYQKYIDLGGNSADALPYLRECEAKSNL